MLTRRSFLQTSLAANLGLLAASLGAENYRRLQGLKLLYDPQNQIRHAQSVRPPS